MSVVKLNDLDKIKLEEWAKNPNNISGILLDIDGDMYSNVFNYFLSKPQDLLTEDIIGNLYLLKGKNIGYVEEKHAKQYADVLLKAGGKCDDLLDKYIEQLGRPRHMKTTPSRMWEAKIIKKELEPIVKMKAGEQCLTVDSLLKVLTIEKTLGRGDFGIVYKAKLKDTSIALKMSTSTISKGALDNLYDTKYNIWSEINIMKKYLNSLLEKGIIQNFPYIYETFICNRCEIEGKKKDCYIIATELANGDLLGWAKETRADKEQQACLFQCMAGLYASQKYFQLTNLDVKAENILYKNCEAGGCWEYVIRGNKYYIPNYGHIFLINDYGVGKSHDPCLDICQRIEVPKKGINQKMFDTGYRPFIRIGNKYTEIQYKVSTTNPTGQVSLRTEKRTFPLTYIDTTGKNKLEADFTNEQRRELELKNIPADPSNKYFYSNSEVVPCHEFYQDTQDLIRIFTGGKRIAQPGNHTGIGNRSLNLILYEYDIKKNFLQARLSSEDLNNVHKLYPGDFIERYFSRHFNTPTGDIIQSFVI